MTTVKPSPARRSATAAPMPREAPVTIATLLVSLVILGLLVSFAVDPQPMGETVRIFHFPDNQALFGITIRLRRRINMDRFDAMRVFTRIVERRSFTLAAEDLGLPRSTVTDAVKQLEARLGVRLLERTTRQGHPPLACGGSHPRCLSLIADVEEAEAAFGGAKPKVLLRVDVHGTLARHFVMPRLPDFLAEYPGIELYMSEGDRLADLIGEGIDCVLRVGDLRDSDMIARRIAMLEEITCAAPAYIDRFGHPASVDALDGHVMVGFHSSGAGAVLPLEFVVNGTVREVTLRAMVSVNAAESLVAAARLGLGLIQVPRYHVEDDLQRGTLVAVLPDCPPSPTPVSLLYTRSRQLSPGAAVFIDYVMREFGTARGRDRERSLTDVARTR